MPINALKKNTPRGKGPPQSSLAEDQAWQMASAEAQLNESDLAAREVEEMWEAEEAGGTRWSGGDEDKRYAD